MNIYLEAVIDQQFNIMQNYLSNVEGKRRVLPYGKRPLKNIKRKINNVAPRGKTYSRMLKLSV